MKEVIQKHQSEKSLTSQAKEVRNSQLFSSARKRVAKEVNQQANCKLVVEKKLTKTQKDIYNYILEEQRIKENVKIRQNAVPKK